MNGAEPEATRSDRLDSWKEIAAYLGRTEKTARRWEQAESLPVRRLVHQERGSVYAFKHELDAWRAARNGHNVPVQETSTVGGRKVVWIGGVVGLAGLVLISGYFLSAASRASRPTLAILPFVTDSPDSSLSYLGSAIAETIVDQLAGATDVRVRPFASSLRFTRDADEPSVVGRRMGVDLIATGRVRPAAGAFQINVALVDVSTNAQVWGTSFHTPQAGVGGTQVAVARAVREQALRHLNGPRYVPPPYAGGSSSDNPEALRLFLKGRGFSRNPGRLQIETSLGYLQEAAQLDPTFVAPRALLAIGHVALAWFGEVPASETFGRAKVYAQQALDLDPSNGWAHQALAGASHYYDFNHQEAEKQFRAAIEANPLTFAGALNWFAEMLIELGRFDEAWELSARAGEADPGWLEVDTVRGNWYLFSGQPQLAIAQYRKALVLEPNHGLSRLFLGRAYFATGRVDEGIAEFRLADQAMGHLPFTVGELGHALARAGRRAEAETLLAEMMKRRETGYYPAFAIAWVHLGLGDADRAIEWLQRALSERLVGYYQPSVDTIYDPLRSDSRFQELLRRMNLPDVQVARASHRDGAFAWVRRIGSSAPGTR